VRRHRPPLLRQRVAPATTGPTREETDQLSSLCDTQQWERLEAEARRVTAQHPAHPSGWKALVLALERRGLLQEAAAAAARATQVMPHDAESHRNLGHLLRRLGRLAEAEAAYRRALGLQPSSAETYATLGDVLHELRRHAEAEACYTAAVAISPNFAEAHLKLGEIRHDLDRLDKAEASYRRALAIRPNLAEAHGNLAIVLHTLGRAAEAEECCRRALAIRPDFADAHSNLAKILHDLGRLAEAEESYRRALSIRPHHAVPHYNLGNLLRACGRFDEARECYYRALAIRPQYADALNNLGNVLEELGRLREAEDCYRRALVIQPDCARYRSNLLFGLLYNAVTSASYLDEAVTYGRIAAANVSQRYSAWLCPMQPRRLRVGLVSGDLRRHVVGLFLDGVLASIDRARIDFLAYSTTAEEDELTARLRPCFSAWRPLFGIDDEAAARLIHEDGLHVLIDLSGHTARNRLPVFAWKPAPVQASWLGYFATTGVAEIDWFLADETGVPPQHQGHFTERLWYLPETRLCFTPPDTAEPVAPLPALRRGFVCFGSFQKRAKIDDAVLRVWSRVLAACPGARLRVQNGSFADAQAAESFRVRLEAQGIGASRVELHGPMPRDAYLAAHAEVDILLDTFPFPGGTTTCEALWMGVPTVTLAGETLIARQGASLLTAAGLPEWIAEDEDDYVAKALAYAADLEGLARLRAGLREQVAASPLFDAPRFARHLEEALWGMWHEWAEREGDRP
jgi:protein O-GlcNAc transferase